MLSIKTLLIFVLSRCDKRCLRELWPGLEGYTTKIDLTNYWNSFVLQSLKCEINVRRYATVLELIRQCQMYL